MVYRQTARSEAARAETRERIMAAALKLFTERGYEATTMQDIVSQAGTSIGNAYFYFGSKDLLVREVIEVITERVLDETEEEAAKIPAGPARIGAMIASRVNSFLGPRRPVTQLLLSTDQRLGTLDLVEDITVGRWIPQLRECFPDRPEEEIPAVATAIWTVNRSIIQRVLQGKLDFDREAVVRFVVTWSLRALEVPDPEIEAIIQAELNKPPVRVAKAKRRR